jgi:hypothetical protein
MFFESEPIFLSPVLITSFRISMFCLFVRQFIPTSQSSFFRSITAARLNACTSSAISFFSNYKTFFSTTPLLIGKTVPAFKWNYSYLLYIMIFCFVFLLASQQYYFLLLFIPNVLFCLSVGWLACCGWRGNLTAIYNREIEFRVSNRLCRNDLYGSTMRVDNIKSFIRPPKAHINYFQEFKLLWTFKNYNTVSNMFPFI